ncbi:ABC transporter permease [Arthrospiribacter ruber]|uniref:ABC transporter permease n=1 Tax=Arthrospiribacter ruber TaxID=2487934 RepID=A0A951IXU7_9BACT|nr:ABC transporter permease [Arthrospiribacter ruber]MBW3468322.1 ABC transporter permease [Arthrospiribacter ruber]
MFKNYFLVAIRNMKREKIYALINIFGLSIGIAFCLLITLFIKDEHSYDKFHPEHEKIFRVSMLENYPDGREYFNTATSQVLGPTLEENFPQIERTIRTGFLSGMVVENGENFQESMLTADPDFFNKFNFPLVSGEPSQALDKINNLVITENYVSKYFAGQDPIGQSLTIRMGEVEEDYVISGVAKNPPTNSSIQFDMVIPFENTIRSTAENARTNFFYVNVTTYAFLEESLKSEQVEAGFSGLFKKLFPDFSGDITVKLQPLASVRLDTDYPGAASDPLYSYILGGLALLVILIAIINFVTLSVGKSVDRAKEVGVRKVMGAVRKQLIGQFWGEAIIISLISVCIGLVLSEVALVKFNELSGKSIPQVLSFEVIWICLLLALLVGFLAGFYPSVFLSRFNPVEVLKGKMKVADAGLMRKSLVIFQFVISVSLIVCALAMNKQMKYIQTKNLGFYKEQVIAIPTGLNEANSQALAERLKNKIISREDVENVGTSFFAIGQSWGEGSFTDADGVYRSLAFNVVDAGFLRTMGVEISSGRDFYEDNDGDKNEGVIVNEALVREFGWDDAIGKSLPGNNFPQHQIVGVVKDFHYAPLREVIEPLILPMSPSILNGFGDIMYSTSPARKITVRAKSEDLTSFMADLENAWKEVAQGQEFNFFFIDQTLANQYEAEIRIGNIIDYSSFFALVIACLGLFSLATMIIKKRVKEIGVRKVLGATETNIAQMFSFEFLKLVLISILLSVPLSFFFISKWMESFVYKADIGMDIYLISGFSAIIIALVSVGYQATKAALMNPVNSLRSGE